MDLKTRLMGLDLSSPLIAASSPLTSNLEDLLALEKAGAGAVVLKSLFEEQILGDLEKATAEPSAQMEHPEAVDYIQEMGFNLHGPAEYLGLIREAKKALSIPVIASLNCIGKENWSPFAQQIEGAGADALELNLSFFVADPDENGNGVEERYYQVIRDVRRHCKIPLSVKIGPYFSNLGKVVRKFQDLGVSSVVLFNRFYPLDFDLGTMSLKPGQALSQPIEIEESLRWVSVLWGAVDLDLVASKGIHTGRDGIKMILAGASAFQVASALIKKGPQEADRLLEEFKTVMKEKGWKNLDDFRGLLSRAKSKNPAGFERLQYVKSLNAQWDSL